MSRYTSLGARTLFAACLGFALSLPVSAEEGKTIFADNRKGTLKAMKSIVKAIGVGKKGSCLFCHVREGGKPVFAKDTPNKRIVRMMKVGFIDSLVINGRVELEVTESEHKTRILAEYQADGEDAGIHLTATLMHEHGETEHESGEHESGEHGDTGHGKTGHGKTGHEEMGGEGGEHGEKKEADSHQPRTFSAKIPLPAKGEPITCMTCHNGELHFLSKAD